MIDPSLMPTLRSYCDGELSHDETARFEQMLASNAELQNAVAFEKALRQRVKTALGAASPMSVQSELASRVRSALAGAETAPIADAPAPLPMRRTQPAAPATIAPSPTWRINYLAVAAVITLVVGAVLFGIYFPNIESFRGQESTIEQAELLSNIAVAVSGEHDRCAHDKSVADDKLPLNDLADTAYELSSFLGARVTPIDLSSLGYGFNGGGRGGALPCGGPSGHLLFQRIDAQGNFISGPNISVFFVPRSVLADYLKPDNIGAWVYNTDIQKKCGHKVLRLDYPASGLVYFLVCCDQEMLRPAAELVLEQLNSACR